MHCGKCGAENPDTSLFCKECGTQFEIGHSGEEAAAVIETTPMARFLSKVWSRKGPILMALFIGLMMGTVFAPWAFIKLEVVGISLVSKTFNGWEIFIPRILFFLSIIPLIVSMFMILGISSRRQVIETHVCTFFGGVIFTIWIITFALSEVLSSLIKNVNIITVNVSSGQIATIILFIGFMFSVFLTSFDRGRRIEKY